MKIDRGRFRSQSHIFNEKRSPNDRPIYIDIDGTLTKDGKRMWGEVIPERIIVVRALLRAGKQVVIWSGGGTAYAKAFVDQHDLQGAIAIGKPEYCIDDNPTIRPRMSSRILSPKAFFDNSIWR